MNIHHYDTCILLNVCVSCLTSCCQTDTLLSLDFFDNIKLGTAPVLSCQFFTNVFTFLLMFFLTLFPLQMIQMDFCFAYQPANCVNNCAYRKQCHIDAFIHYRLHNMSMLFGSNL